MATEERSVVERGVRASWYRGATLGERIAALRGSGSAGPFDAAAGARELAGWRAQAPFDSGDWFARRLAQDGTSEEELRRLLGEPAEAVAARAGEVPAWVLAIERAYSRDPRPLAESVPLPDAMGAGKTFAFLDALEPLLAAGFERLRSGAEALADDGGAPFDPLQASALFLGALPWRLHAMISRTMVLEMHGARLAGELEGATGEERFASFLRRLHERERALELLADYPVLARRVLGAIERHVDFGLGFLGHLREDAGVLSDALGAGRPLGELVSLDTGSGDAHRGGRGVVIAGFDSGLQVVYKPHSLAVDAHFQELLSWLNERGDHPPFRTLTVLDRGDHGWVEHVTARPCAGAEELARFHRRQGGQLALLHVLEATDFHFENLIAAGDQPVLVDLETLFHPRLPIRPTGQPDLDIVSDATVSSVLRVGLLPRRSFGDGEFEGVDLSGMSEVDGQLTPDLVLQWDAIGTDAMRVSRKRMEMPGGKNRPVAPGTAPAAGERSDLLAFQPDLERGFREVYRTLMEHRGELLAADGPIRAFADDDVRVVLRATRAYGLLLSEQNHPELQGDSLELERFLDRLWIGVDECPPLLRVLGTERDALLCDDVPYFSTRPGSRDLLTDDGRRIEAFFESSGLAAVERRIAELGAADLERQMWFLRASLATLALDSEELHWPSYRIEPPRAEPDPEALRAEMIANARRIGDRLGEVALRSSEGTAWVGLAFSNRRWNLVALLDDLYSGVSGLALFLTRLWAVTGEERYGELARAGLATFRRRLEFTRGTTRSVGAFSGWGGVVYALAHCGAALGDEQLLDEAEGLCSLFPELIEADTDLDLVGGSAGAICGLLALYAARPRPHVLDLARHAGEHLLARAVPMDEGCGWFTRIETEQPITGLSHGASGIAFGLLRLFAATGDERCRRTALGALRYERTRFDAEQGNWEDPADPRAGAAVAAARPMLSVAWCYGAPGIGLTRLLALDLVDDPQPREELEIAVRTTLERGFGRNHSLCHGDVGNLDFLSQAAARLGDPELGTVVRRVSASVLESMRSGGWLCGVPLGVEAPSLMNGLAGTGYGLLRLAEPARVPSILSLEPPV